MDIKLISIDMDGTALRNDGSLSAPVLQAIKDAAETCLVVPASGRSYAEIPDEILGIPGILYAIAANGASIMDVKDDKEVYSDLIMLSTARRIFEKLDSMGLLFLAYSEGVTFCDHKNMEICVAGFARMGVHYSKLLERMRFVENIGAYFEKANRHVEKIYIYEAVGQNREELLSFLEPLTEVSTTSSNPINLEINSTTANKGSALAWLAENLSIPRENVMSIGDGHNDLEMLSYAGLSVAMGNAVEAAKSISSYVTLSNEEEGLVIALRKFLPQSF